MKLVSLAFSIAVIIAQCKVFEKAGEPWWAAIVPFYNTYKLFEIVYGNGWKFLFLFIPLVNIYFIIKLSINLANVFGEGTGFGLGLLFLAPVFYCILGFGNYEYIGAIE
ncbi:MAG: signal peptidase I [Lachnospiraceae bacterium]|jgi:hypothetical protein|nr:signal peptidase I [Lachnospiraceae bacterium]